MWNWCKKVNQLPLGCGVLHVGLENQNFWPAVINPPEGPLSENVDSKSCSRKCGDLRESLHKSVQTKKRDSYTARCGGLRKPGPNQRTKPQLNDRCQVIRVGKCYRRDSYTTSMSWDWEVTSRLEDKLVVGRTRGRGWQVIRMGT